MKKSVFLFVIIVLAVCLSGKNGTAEVIFAKLATTLPVEHPTSRALLTLQQEIGHSLAGQLQIQLFPDAQLGDAEQILSGLQFGSIELGVVPSDLLPAYSPVFAAVSMPYIFRDQTHHVRVLDGPVGMRLLNSLPPHQLIGLGFLDTGMRNFLSHSAPLETLEEYQNKKIGLIRRCSQKEACSPAISDLVEQGILALGANPEFIEVKDVSVSLQSGVIDGVECSLEEIVSLQLSGIDPLYWNDGMFYSVPDVLVVSKSWFDSLSSQRQDMLWNASRRAINQQRQYWMEHAATLMRELELQGIMIQEEDTEKFREVAQHLQKQAINTYGEEFAAALRSILSVK